MVRISVDRQLCEANGVCEGIAADMFRLDDADRLTVLQSSVPAGDEQLAVHAARMCPRQAITVED